MRFSRNLVLDFFHSLAGIEEPAEITGRKPLNRGETSALSTEQSVRPRASPFRKWVGQFVESVPGCRVRARANRATCVHHGVVVIAMHVRLCVCEAAAQFCLGRVKKNGTPSSRQSMISRARVRMRERGRGGDFNSKLSSVRRTSLLLLLMSLKIMLHRC